MTPMGKTIWFKYTSLPFKHSVYMIEMSQTHVKWDKSGFWGGGRWRGRMGRLWMLLNTEKQTKSLGSWPAEFSDNTSYKPSGKNVFMQEIQTVKWQICFKFSKRSICLQISRQLQRRYQKRIGLKVNLLANPTDKDSTGIQLRKHVHHFPHFVI